MNLLAFSFVDPSLFFVAAHDTILCYRSGGRPIRPFKKLPPLATASFESRVNINQEREPINQIKVGFQGKEEVLVTVGDKGTIRIYFTEDLERAPILLQNDSESTWGLAMHAKRRLVAVSANSHAITLFEMGIALDGTSTSRKLVGHKHNIPSIEFNQLGDLIASCSIGMLIDVEIRISRCVTYSFI
jgi:WD40 repeat protein